MGGKGSKDKQYHDSGNPSKPIVVPPKNPSHLSESDYKFLANHTGRFLETLLKESNINNLFYLNRSFKRRNRHNVGKIQHK